jgi:PAS domain S-box-containing protein
MKSFSNLKVKFAFGFAMLTLFVMGPLSYRWMVDSEQSDHAVRHSHVVIENIQNLALAMTNIEAASREFVLTGRESDLDSYRVSVANVARDEATIRSLTADNPVQQLRFPDLEVLASERIAYADMIMALRRNEGLEAAALGIANGPDERDTEFRVLIDKFQDEEQRLLESRNGEIERDLKQTKSILLIGTVLGIFIAGVAAWAAVRDSAKRALADEALKQSEGKYRLLLDGVPDFAIFMLDPLGVVVSWSASAEHILGFTGEEIINRSFSCFFAPGDIDRGRPGEVLRGAAATGRHEESGMSVRKDGSDFLSSATYVALRNPAGNLLGFSEICRDLTEHKESEAKYRGLLEAAPDAMVVVNEGGEIVLLNAQTEKQFGYRRDEIQGKKITTIIPEGFAERLIADGTRTGAEALAQQFGTGIELRGLRKDGNEFPIEIMLSPLESSTGILVTAAIRNITLRKDAEKHLEQMEARYRGLLEAAPDGIVVLNDSGEIVLLNAQAEKQFGYRRDELLGSNVKEIIPERFAERLTADALRTAADTPGPRTGTGIELDGRRKDGTLFPIEIMLSPLESADGVLITAAIRDISKARQMARQLRQSQKMDAIGQLTGGIAHDFNNLLTIIIGNLGLIEPVMADNEEAIKFLKPAQKAAARGAGLTRRLLALASQEDLKPSWIKLEEAIQETIELAGRALGPGIKILTSFDKSVPNVYVDATGLGSALLNLAVNARDAMPKGGSLTIATTSLELDGSFPSMRTGDLPLGHYACISVSDTGHGMSKETLERAMEPFFTTKGRDKGTGLGLSMVYGFAKQSGGTVRIYSEQEHGTTVSLYLPLMGATAPEVLESPQTSLTMKLGGTVLIVDDEPDLLEIAHAYLTEMGYSALRADNSASALNIVAQYEEIDLLLTDIIMPGGMNGVELAEKVRKLRPDLKVIYTSGFPADAFAESRGTEINGPMLRKPYHRPEFAAMIQRTMEGGTPLAPNSRITVEPTGSDVATVVLKGTP